ncbi:hypothetical protein BDZ85DRAFT_13580 [Elsinoe ampelina]|uniref:Uncharacterized protein n=1 Tax=Elsinoe ampelina TaxID=302913 RepID=A0A6A6GRM5_9PEZI|nr:hypothetical protein BDZ85DRAFT_13580 [Elsinoe ampelina]
MKTSRTCNESFMATVTSRQRSLKWFILAGPRRDSGRRQDPYMESATSRLPCSPAKKCILTRVDRLQLWTASNSATNRLTPSSARRASPAVSATSTSLERLGVSSDCHSDEASSPFPKRNRSVSDRDATSNTMTNHHESDHRCSPSNSRSPPPLRHL